MIANSRNKLAQVLGPVLVGLVLLVVQGHQAQAKTAQSAQGSLVEEINNRFSSPLSRIVNGLPVPEGKRLFQVALLRRGKFICGGSLIDKRFVITAAHCVEGGRPRQYLIRYGTHKFNDGPTVRVRKIIVHPKYSGTKVINDLAIIMLQNSILENKQPKVSYVSLNVNSAVPEFPGRGDQNRGSASCGTSAAKRLEDPEEVPVSSSTDSSASPSNAPEEVPVSSSTDSSATPSNATEEVPVSSSTDSSATPSNAPEEVPVSSSTDSSASPSNAPEEVPVSSTTDSVDSSASSEDQASSTTTTSSSTEDESNATTDEQEVSTTTTTQAPAPKFTQVTVSGWGKTARNQTVSEQLLWANLSIITLAECRQSWSPYFVVSKGMICASHVETSACNGDSGGPLTWNDQLAGVVSLGSPNCHSDQLPNVYTDIYHYRDWINTVIMQKSLEPELDPSLDQAPIED